jgi:hypothetical protein
MPGSFSLTPPPRPQAQEEAGHSGLGLQGPPGWLRGKLGRFGQRPAAPSPSDPRAPGTATEAGSGGAARGIAADLGLLFQPATPARVRAA